MFKKDEEFYRKENNVDQKQSEFEELKEYKMDEEENAKMKGDGQPYVAWANEEYDKMTDEERKEVDEIGKKLNTILGINDDD